MESLQKFFQISPELTEKIIPFIKEGVKKMIDDASDEQVLKLDGNTIADALSNDNNLVLKVTKAIKDSLKSSVDNISGDNLVQYISDTYPRRSMLNESIRALNLSSATKGILENANIQTIGQLIEYPFDELVKFKRLGTGKVTQIQNSLSNIGLSLAKK